MVKSNPNVNQKYAERGFSSIVLLFIAFAIIVLFGLYVYKLVFTSRETPEYTPTPAVSEIGGATFEELPEDESTPDTIDNDSLDELDKIMIDIESDTTLDAEPTF